MPASDHEGPVQAEFACARCWKQKKKCDKVAPRCGRCTLQTAVCIYSSHPPKESVFSVNRIETPGVQQEVLPPYQIGCLSLDPPHTNHNVSDNRLTSSNYDSTSRRLSGQPCNDNWEQEFIAQVQNIFTASGKDAESICQTYFAEFHPWLSFISEPDFWRNFSSVGSYPEFSTLILGMYLVTHIPDHDSNYTEILDPVYLIAKKAWLRFQRVQEPSMVLIQAGLLIATYESGQALTEKSRSSMVACAEMGYNMRLHKSLRRNLEGDECGQNELKAQRQLWWGIVALERFLAAKDLDHSYIFATPHPKLDDYLPSDHNGSFSDIPSPKVVGAAAREAAEPAELFFADVDAYPGVVQACYLLGRVMNFIKSNTLSPEQQETESMFLDRTLQIFARSLLRQASGSSSASTVQGHYCTPFLLSLIALVTLHQHELKKCSSFPHQDQCISAESPPPPRPILALRALSRMFSDMTGSLKFSDGDLLKLPPFEILIFYLSLWLDIKFGEKSDKAETREGLRRTLAYLRVVTSRWRIAEVYVAEIAALQIGGSSNEYPWLTQV